MLVLYLSLLDGEDEGKFERLYYKYRRLMFTCAKEILKDDVLAEDAVHEAFLRLTKHMKGIDEVKCNKTLRFVVIVVESAAKDIYRKKKGSAMSPGKRRKHSTASRCRRSRNH